MARIYYHKNSNLIKKLFGIDNLFSGYNPFIIMACFLLSFLGCTTPSSETPRIIQRLIDPIITPQLWDWEKTIDGEPTSSDLNDLIYYVVLRDVGRRAVVLGKQDTFSHVLHDPGTGKIELWGVGIDKNISDHPSAVQVKITLKNNEKLVEEILTLTCINSSENFWVKFEIPISKMMGEVECRMELVNDKAFPTQSGNLAIIGTPVFIPENIQMPPNVILVCIDSLRADDLGAYGSPLACSPTIDRLSRQGILFSQSLSTSSWTVPGVKNLLSGYHTIQEQREGDKLEPDSGYTGKMIQELYAEAGYTTLGVIANPLITPKLGFEKGFDMFDTFAVRTWFPGSNLSIYEQIDTALKLHLNRPIFMYIHFMDPHDPHTPIHPFDLMLETPPNSVVRENLHEKVTGFLNREPAKTELLPLTDKENQYLRNHYRNELRETDSFLHCVLQSLYNYSSYPENTLVVITADHGEEFGEHSHYQHGFTVYEAVVRVPWIMSYPSLLPLNHIETGWVSTMDIPPTLARLTVNKKLPCWKGHCVFPKQADYPENRLLYTSSRTKDVPDSSWVRWRAAYCNEKKLIWVPSGIKGFDLELQPEEQALFEFSSFKKLAESHLNSEWKALGQDLKQFIDSLFEEGHPEKSIIQMKQLRELGYIQ